MTLRPGYYQQATISQDKVVFVCDDGLWLVPASGGTARRLTASEAECSNPRLSPDGKSIAFISYEEGHPEVFVMSCQGGPAKRLTYLGSQSCSILHWRSDSKSLVICSDARSPFYRHDELFEITIADAQMSPLNLGHATAYSADSKGRVVIGRNSRDPALWKRYKGGRAGEIWIAGANMRFKQLLKLNGNAVSPMLINDRVYFLSDHEGVGNIYSVKADGKDLRRHSSQIEYYLRFPSSDGKRIIYNSAGDIYIFDCATEKTRKLEIEADWHEAQSSRRFVDAFDYLEHYSINMQGSALGFISRGQAFSMPLFAGACVQHSPGSHVRSRFFEWFPDGDEFVVVDDADGYERIAKHSKKAGSEKVEYLGSEDIGQVRSLSVSPAGHIVAITNQRHELLFADVKGKKVYLMDTSPAGQIQGLAWSPDGRWLAYVYFTQSNMSVIKVLDTKSNKSHEITKAVRMDFDPCFCPEGKYLFFLSNREFKPVYDSQHFDLSFPLSIKPYAIPLTKDTESPFAPDTKPFFKDSAAKAAGEDAQSKSKESKKEAAKAKAAGAKDSASADAKTETPECKIDLEGIADRIKAFPFSAGLYSHLCAASGRILFISNALKGISRDFDWYNDEGDGGSLIAYDFAERKTISLQRGLYDMRLGPDGRTLAYLTKDCLRVIDALQPAEKAAEAADTTPGRASGYIDLRRCNLLVEPRKEWAQIYREAWRLQKAHFWDPKMSSVDWELVYERYAKLLPRLRTRSELSDLIWEMQGELGTSHAYEFGGERPYPRPYYKGFLGSDLSFQSKESAYKIVRILRGDSWEQGADSPLAEPGLDIEEGDLILEVNGRKVSRELSVDELLLKSGNSYVQLKIKRGTKIREVAVKTLNSERYLRYRHWVESNRQYVSRQSKDKLGYIHIPDMGPFGYSEFHRHFLSEFHHEGLVVDARYNRGGHVSSLLLEKLLRKRVGYDLPRWGQPQPYPLESPAGPLVAITNQFAGSDGDIFSHCFKLYKLGPLVGKRTWGGVIGISPQQRLVDGSLTTQPEYSFWFEDVGWSVENYGTDPDYEVDICPHDYADGKDPQLDKAIALAMEALKTKPVRLPGFKSRPRLSLPKKLQSQ